MDYARVIVIKLGLYKKFKQRILYDIIEKVISTVLKGGFNCE